MYTELWTVFQSIYRRSSRPASCFENHWIDLPVPVQACKCPQRAAFHLIWKSLDAVADGRTGSRGNQELWCFAQTHFFAASLEFSSGVRKLETSKAVWSASMWRTDQRRFTFRSAQWAELPSKWTSQRNPRNLWCKNDSRCTVFSTLWAVEHWHRAKNLMYY